MRRVPLFGCQGKPVSTNGLLSSQGNFVVQVYLGVIVGVRIFTHSALELLMGFSASEGGSGRL